MTAIEALKTRRSIRAYQSTPVPRDLLVDLVDCARLAPTGMNEQPWEFVIVTDTAMRQKIADLITHQKGMASAPAYIAVLCRDTKFYVEDGSAATMNILLAAHAHGLGACWVSGDKQPYADAVRDLLGGRPPMKLFSVVTVGYPAEKPVKDKRPLESVLHWEKL